MVCVSACVYLCDDMHVYIYVERERYTHICYARYVYDHWS